MKRMVAAAAACALVSCGVRGPEGPGAAAPATSAPIAGAEVKPAEVAPAKGTYELGQLQRVGTVHFSTSCDPAVSADFLRAVALLHSFFYEEARNVFASVATRDPSCAIAQWGVAMTWYHPIWTPPSDAELASGRGALDRAKAIGAKTERERDYIDALGAFYATEATADPRAVGQSCHGPGGGHTARAMAYTTAMKALHEKHPDDDEATTFYALSLLGSAPVDDKTLSGQLAAAALLEDLWKKNHDHPGVVHYLIHAYDYPALAPRGLEAARAYGSIAPWVPHALHMPSHIFTRLGLWQESLEANLASADAARAYQRKYHPDAASFEELHALDYLVYAYLQTEQDGKAKGVVDRLQAMHATHPETDFVVAYAAGAIPARYALERRAWAEAAALPLPLESSPLWGKFPFDAAHIEFAHAVGRARLGDVAGARAALAHMGELEDKTVDPRFTYFKKQLGLQRAAADALVSYREGRRDAALSALATAADAEDALGKHPVSPGTIVPIRELLGDLLLDSHRPADALAAYEGSLKVSPRRFAALYGAGRAAELSGKADLARLHYAELLEVSRAGDHRRDEVAYAERYVGNRHASP